MSEIKFAKFSIVCNLYVNRTEEIELRYIEDSDGKNIYAPFNGCDFYNPCAVCQNCKRKLNKYLTEKNHNPHELLSL